MSETKVKPEYLYLNDKQIAFIYAHQKTKVFIGGRAAGKTTVLGAMNALRCQNLPKGKVAWVGPSIDHLKTKVVPSAFEMINRIGFKEHKDGQEGHYVIFRKPPASWDSPYQKPYKYDKIITFRNGYTIQLLTWFDADSERGINLDGMDIDEAGWLEKNIYDGVLLPAIRGNVYRYPNNGWHQQVCMYTSKPRLSIGQWVTDYEELASIYYDDYFFIKCSSWDNVQIIGEKTLKKWQREMNPIEYAIEVMCEEVGKIPNGFYDEFEFDKHGFLSRFTDTEIDGEQPLYLSFDFNAGFICCLVAQVTSTEIRIVRELFVKGTKIIDHLLDIFLHEFLSHKKKSVKIYGDRAGNNKQVNSMESFFQMICRYLEEGGWETDLCAMTFYPEHQDRHNVINKAMKEDNPDLPLVRISKRGCVFLLLCIGRTAIKIDFKKDKSSETDPAVPPEQSTHLTDAFDYLIYPIIKPKIDISSNMEDTRIEFL
jgi:hypothetical protein